MQVSIIIPTYNSAAYLERAFASAIGQEGVDFEVIIVDNNSTDGTLAVMEKLRALHPDQVRLAKEAVQGAAAARNHGVRIAKGEWIQFLDSDDVLLAGKLRRQLGLVDEGTDWVVGSNIQIGLDGLRITTQPNKDAWKGLVHNGGLGDTNSNLIRREIFLQIGGQREYLRSGEDTEMNFRLLKARVSIVRDVEPGSVYIDRLGFRLSEINDSVARSTGISLKASVREYLQENKPEYYSRNASFFTSEMLSSIRILATSSIEEAEVAFKHYFPKGVHAHQLDKAIVSGLVYFYPILGFKLTEQIRLFVARVLPTRVKMFLKGR